MGRPYSRQPSSNDCTKDAIGPDVGPRSNGEDLSFLTWISPLMYIQPLKLEKGLYTSTLYLGRHEANCCKGLVVVGLHVNSRSLAGETKEMG